MGFYNFDESMILIFLLEACNFDCVHCVREDEPMQKGYKLTFDQLTKCLKDCQNLNTIEWVHFSGGEPTLWTEGDRDLVDLLLEISKAGFEPGFTTNGSMFLEYAKCQDLFDRYFNNAGNKLRLYFSVDTFHNNYDPEIGRAKCLDNIVKYKLQLPDEKKKLLDIFVLVTISKDPDSLLPQEMVKYYQSQDIEFIFVPLKAEGKARSLSESCPNLSSTDPDGLGAYYQFYKKKINHLSNIVLISDDYYFYKNDFRIAPERRWYQFAELGHLNEKNFRKITENFNISDKI